MSENYMLLPFKSAAPFWSSILFAVSLWLSFFLQGWAILFVPILTLLILPLVDQYVGLRVENLNQISRLAFLVPINYPHLGTNPIHYFIWNFSTDNFCRYDIA